MSAGTAPWRAERARLLLDFASASALDTGGFGWLDEHGRPDPARPRELWINARMTYVFSLAHLQGSPGAGELAAHGVQALRGLFHDDEHGGWHAEIDHDGVPAPRPKGCYEHAFVVLAGAVATEAGVDGARELFDEALAVHEERFWDEESGACVEEWSSDWAVLDDYRGANSNMHTVEAYLFAADTTGDEVWRQRARRIIAMITGHARQHEWRIPEHYDATWTPLPDYNIDLPADPFRPWGATPGHAFEWSRLMVTLGSAAPADAEILTLDARSLFDRAVADAVGSEPGLPYTTDWSGQAVVAERFHWVVAEAVLAADALHRRAGIEAYAALAQRWWDEIDTHFVDHDNGSWRHELSPTMGPSARTWQGRPDAYHAWNALLFPDLPISPTAARALAARSDSASAG